MKLGKLSARPGVVKLKLSDYTNIAIPSKFGYYKLEHDWGMLGNDTVGDCVLAGAGHETMLWNAEAGKTITITAEDALSDYSAITGYDPTDPNSDQGTDMQVAASYRKNTGITDGTNRHKIEAYLALEPGNVNHIKQAIYLFSACGIGIRFPASAMTQFNQGKNWTVTNSQIEGGHYVPAVGYDSRYLYVVTWGKLQKASWGFIKKYMDEGLAYVSSEFLTKGQSPQNFNLAQLEADLNNL